MAGEMCKGGRKHAQRLAERAAAEKCLRLAEHLPPGDRLLVETVLAQGRSLRQLAQATGRPHNTLSLRLRRILARMQSPEFHLVAQRGALFERADRRAAELLFLEGQSIRAAARRTGRPYHSIRRVSDSVRRLVALFDVNPPQAPREQPPFQGEPR